MFGDKNCQAVANINKERVRFAKLPLPFKYIDKDFIILVLRNGQEIHLKVIDDKSNNKSDYRFSKQFKQ